MTSGLDVSHRLDGQPPRRNASSNTDRRHGRNLGSGARLVSILRWAGLDGRFTKLFAGRSVPE